MGVTVSTSLARIKENSLLLRFVGTEAVAQGDGFWRELLTFTTAQPASQLEARLLDEAVSPLVEALVRHNGRTGHLRTLVRLLLEMMRSLCGEISRDNNLATLHTHNALLIVRVCVKQLLIHHSEEEVIVQLDGAITVPQLTSLKRAPEPQQAEPHATTVSSSGGDDPLIGLVSAPPDSSSKTWNKDRSPTTGERNAGEGGVPAEPLPPGSSVPASLNPTEVVAMDMLLSRQLVEGVVSLLINGPLSPYMYEVHNEAISLLLVLLSSQMYGFSSGSGILLQHILSIPQEQCSLLVQRLITHFSTQPPPPPSNLHSPSLLSSITSGIWSMMSSSATATQQSSLLADQAVLLLLALTHQQMHGHNPYRQSLFQFTDSHSNSKSNSAFSVSLEKLYFSFCNNLSEQTTLLLYLLLQGNSHFASFVFSRSDIDLLVTPLLHHLHDSTHHVSSAHHVYMLLIVLLIFSQDDCFNKSIHELSLQRVVWYTERSLTSISVGSLMVIVLVRTIQSNVSQIQDKYLHTNCLAALANMSSHFHSLHLDAAQKIVNLFKQLAKKHHKMTEKLKTTPTTTPTATPLNQETETVFSEAADYATDQGIVEEILLMILEIINSCLTHRLQHNPHLVYSLLYQREVFEPFRSNPSLMDIIRNIESVVEFFSKKLEETGPSPYSSPFVLETIIKSSQTWPRRRLRVFPDLKFRYVEEAQPEEFFVPYVWTLVHKNSPLHWHQFTSSSSSSSTPH